MSFNRSRQAAFPAQGALRLARSSAGAAAGRGCPDLEVSCSTQLLERPLFPTQRPREAFYLEDAWPAQRRGEVERHQLCSRAPPAVTLT